MTSTEKLQDTIRAGHDASRALDASKPYLDRFRARVLNAWAAEGDRDRRDGAWFLVRAVDQLAAEMRADVASGTAAQAEIEFIEAEQPKS